MTKKTLTKLIISLGLIFAILSFLWLTFNQYTEIEPSGALTSLKESDVIREVGPWDVEFFQCGGQNLSISSTCLKLNQSRVMLRLSDPIETFQFINHTFKNATHARIKHQFSYSDLDWIASKPIVSIMMPKMLHYSTSMKLEENVIQTNYGNGSDSVFTVSSRIIHQTGSVVFDVTFEKATKVFGPQFYPVAISTPKFSNQYLELEKKRSIVFELNKQIEITVPAFLAAMSLIFDHAPSLHLVTIFSITRTLQSFFYNMAKDQTVFSPTIIRNFLYLINAFSFVLLILLTITMSRIANLSFYQYSILFTLALSLGFLIGWYSFDSASKHLLKLDCIGTSICILISIVAIFKNSFQKRVRESSVQLASDYFSNKYFYYARMLVLVFGLGLSFFLSLDDLLYLSNFEIEKAGISLKHHVLVPILMFTIFLELGSTVNWMDRMTKSIKERFKMDQDLQIGRELQNNLLPSRKFKNDVFSYRILFSPVRPISGSYHDVSYFDMKKERSKSSSSRFIAVIQGDLPGDGFSAALMTNILASHWGIWKKSLSTRPPPDNHHQLKEYLREAALRIREGMGVLSLPGSLSITFALIDTQQKVMAYSNYGTTPVLIGSHEQSQFRAVSTNSMRLNPNTDLTNFQAGLYQFNEEDIECLFFSLSVCPLRMIPSEFAQDLLDNKEKPVLTQLVSSLRASKKMSRKSPELFSDFCVIHLKLTKSAGSTN